MKPRIRYLHESNIWACNGLDMEEFDNTPTKVYYKWLYSVIERMNARHWDIT